MKTRFPLPMNNRFENLIRDMKPKKIVKDNLVIIINKYTTDITEYYDGGMMDTTFKNKEYFEFDEKKYEEYKHKFFDYIFNNS